MAKILVMGGSRFIGKHLLKKISGNEITVINRGNIPTDKYLPENATHIKADRNNEVELKAILENKQFDIVYDICAITKEHVEILLSIIQKNVKRHVHVSTGSVYDLEAIPDDYPLDEDFKIGAIDEKQHPYMNNKRGAEKAIFEAYSKGYPVTIVRPTFVYGPDNYVYREAYFFDRISKERAILIPEDGEGYFDLIHVSDLADIIVLLGNETAQKVEGKAFNASRGKFTNGKSIANIVAKFLKTKPKIQYFKLQDLKDVNWPENKPLYPYVPKGIMGFSSEKIASELGFLSKFDYNTGLKNSYDWWKNSEPKKQDYKIEDLFISYLELKEKNDNNSLEKLKSKIIDYWKQGEDKKKGEN